MESSQSKLFCYMVVDTIDECDRMVAPSLMALKSRMGPEHSDKWLDDIDIHAYFSEGEVEVMVPASVYCQQSTPTRLDALEFIECREENVTKHLARGDLKAAKYSRICGAGRCLYEDPLEVQIEDYLKTAPLCWLPDDELERSEREWLSRQIV